MDVGCLILFSPQSCEAVRQFFYQMILSYKLINSCGVQFLFRTSEFCVGEMQWNHFDYYKSI